MKRVSRVLWAAGILLWCGLLLGFSHVDAADLDITIDPELDITRFSPYNIYVASIPNPDDVASVDLTLTGINGNGGTSCWDYYINGTCESSPIELPLTENISMSRWESPNIYPDYIYPETFFASSETTWNNAPMETPIYRQSYEIFHFNNPFTMVDDMSFWIELNARPNHVNSSDLEIYLVHKSATITTFQSDWRNSALVENVGTYDSSATFHHQHTPNSQHLLVSLHTNADGTIGNKSLDVSGDFWVVLYSKSPNIARSWMLRYQPPALCTYSSRWFTADQFGWSTLEASGCPDAHIHVARRTDNMDGVHAEVTVHYDDSSTDTDTEDLFFGTLPNLAPNSTLFLTPYRGGAYSGTFDISWDPASDANNDSLLYTIELLDSEGSLVDTIVSDTASTSVSFDSTLYDDGAYLVRGTVCDDADPSLCTGFESDTSFNISNDTAIATITSILISTSHESGVYAKAGDVIELVFLSSAEVQMPTVDFYAGGYTLLNTISVEEVSANTWRARVVVSASDHDGRVSFDIISSNLDQIYIDSTDGSYVLLDTSVPSVPSPSVEPGNYESAVEVVLSSAGASFIRYTTNGDTPTCMFGTLYEEPIAVDRTMVILAVGCDDAGNASSVVELSFRIGPLPDTGVRIIESLVVAVFVVMSVRVLVKEIA